VDYGEELLTMLLISLCRNHKEIVFARVSPHQKLIIVEGFQRLGEVSSSRLKVGIKKKREFFF